jgi:hypothetical protein
MRFIAALFGRKTETPPDEGGASQLERTSMFFDRAKSTAPEDIVQVTGKTSFKKQLRWLIGQEPAGVMTITPEMAEIMMERNVDEEWHNRPESPKGLRRYVAGMKAGWKLTGETIIFSKSGRLVNGQHRLIACINSGCSFQCIVVFGIDDDAFKFMDSGITRTAGHIFAIEDIPNATNIAAASRLLYGYKRSTSWDGRSPDVENDTLLEFYRDHTRLQDALTPARVLYAERLIPHRWGTFCFYICAEKSRDEAADFFEKVGTGIGLTNKSSPAYLIRKRLLENARSTSDSLSETYIGAYLVQAWNAHRRGESRKIFRWRTEQNPNESFPRAE